MKDNTAKLISSGQNLIDENKLLDQKNKALSNQLDKVTSDLFRAQEIATDLKNQLDEKKHTEQLAGWAIDRAIEAAKLFTAKPNSVEEIVKIAHDLCDGVKGISADNKMDQKETMQ